MRRDGGQCTFHPFPEPAGRVRVAGAGYVSRTLRVRRHPRWTADAALFPDLSVTTTSGPADRRTVLTRAVLAVVGILAFVVFSFVLAGFLSVDNMITLLNEVALAGIVAVPATFLMMSGQVDLSVGGAAAFAGVVLAASAPGLGVPAAVLLAAGSGLLIGLGNGLLVTVGRVDSIAATFATMALLRGLAYLVPGGLVIALAGFRSAGDTGPFAGIALAALIFGAVAVIAGGLSRSAAGRRSRATGRLPVVDRFDGQRERHRVTALFVVSGVSAALVGLITAWQLGAGLPTAAVGLEVTVVSAVLLGGGRLAGGAGSVAGTLLALLVISIVGNGLALANVNPYAGPVLSAALLIFALVIDRPHRRSGTRLAGPARTDSE